MYLAKNEEYSPKKSIFVYHVFAAGGIRAKPQHHAAGRSSGGNRQPTPGHVQPVCSCILSTGWSSLLVSLRPSSRPLNSPFTPLHREFLLYLYMGTSRFFCLVFNRWRGRKKVTQFVLDQCHFSRIDMCCIIQSTFISSKWCLQ